MGNIMAIDIGIVLVSITLFDKHNSIFPVKIVEKKSPSLLSGDSYFEVDQSFYSIKHGGTFHFAHFNMHYFREFLESNAFDAIMKFVEENSEINSEHILLKELAKRNMVSEHPLSPSPSRKRSASVNVDDSQKFMGRSKRISAPLDGSLISSDHTEKIIKEAEYDEEHKDFVFDATDDQDLKIGEGFPSRAMLDEIVEEFGVVRDLNGIQLLCT